MAIRGNKTVVPPAADTKEEVQTETTETQAETQTQEQAPAETKTVATTQAAGAVATVDDTSVMPTIASLKDKWDPEMHGNMFKRVVGTNGALVLDKKTSLGDWADIQIYSHSRRKFITPIVEKGDDNYEERNYFCRPSYDGKTIPSLDGDEPMTIEEYEESISEEFPKGVKQAWYHDIFAVVLGSQKGFTPDMAATPVQFSVAPTSVKSFNAYSMTTKLAVVKGLVKPSHQNCVRVTAIPITGDFSYVMMEFGAIPVDIADTYVVIPEPD